jgi:citrate synthase
MVSHWKEQLVKNRIFRPTQIYTGAHNEAYIEIEQRNCAIDLNGSIVG